MNKQTTTFSRTLYIVQLAILSAILILMSFTPIGYLKLGPVSITFNTIPVVIGAIVLGPAAGAVLGGIFGATSFIQCFGMDAFGTALLSINPFFTAVVCFVPRILIGVFAALVFRAFSKARKNNGKGILSYAVSALTGAVTNTVFFVGLLVLFFGNAEAVRQMLGDSIVAIITALITANSIIEAIVCTVVGGAIAKAIFMAVNKRTEI